MLAVGDLVAHLLGIKMAPSAVKATVAPNTEIVQIRCIAGTAQRAQDCAHRALPSSSWPIGPPRLSLSRTSHWTDSASSSVRLEDKLTAATSRCPGGNPPADAAAQVQLADQPVHTLQAARARLGGPRHHSRCSVIYPRSLPSKPTGLSPILLLARAGVPRTRFGVALAVWRERTDDRLQSLRVLRSWDPAAVQPAAVRTCHARLLTERATGDSIAQRLPPGADGDFAADPHPATSSFRRFPATVHRPTWRRTCPFRSPRRLQVTLVDAGIDETEVAALLDIETGPETCPTLPGGNETLPRTIDRRDPGAAGRTDPRRARPLTPARGLPFGAWSAAHRDRLRHCLRPDGRDAEGNAVALASDGLVLVFPDRATTHHELGEIIDDAERLGVTCRGDQYASTQSGRRGHRSPGRPARPATRRAARPASASATDGVVRGSADRGERLRR